MPQQTTAPTIPVWPGVPQTFSVPVWSGGPQAPTTTLTSAPTMAVNQMASSVQLPTSLTISTPTTLQLASILPKFNKTSSTSWFIRFDTITAMYNLNDVEKFATLASLIPQELDATLQHSWININAQPPQFRYNLLKTSLLSCTNVTSAERSFRLMTLPYLGQRQPSDLMTELLKLVDPPGSFSDDNLHLFLSRLPYDLARQHIDKSAAEVTDPMSFALRMDRELEASRRHQGANTTQKTLRVIPQTLGSQQSRTTPAASTSQTKTSTKPNTLGSQQTWKGSTAKPQQNTASSTICYYHQRFGSSSRTCVEGCTWQALMSIDQRPHQQELEYRPSTAEDDSAGTTNFIKCRVSHLSFYIDTGASLSFLPRNIAKARSLSIRPDGITTVSVADGRDMPIDGFTIFKIDLGTGPVLWKFYVTTVAFPIIGRDFFVFADVLVDTTNNKLVPRQTLPLVKHINSPTLSTVAETTSLCDHVPQSLRKFEHLFGDLRPNEFDTFKVQSTMHFICTEGAPCSARVRRLNIERLDVLRQYIADMLRNDVIRPSSSPWSSPLTIAKKKDNSWRICGDYRQLNLMTQRDAYPIPNILDVQNCLHGKKVFSKLDMLKGFWQVPMAEQDIPKTAVITPLGLFEFKRMPFGLRNSSNTFQRVMNEAFRDMKDVFVYVDDLLVASENREKHEEVLNAVFHKLQEQGLGIAVQKCRFFQDSVKFLGFHIDENGASPPTDRVAALCNMPIPSTPKQMQSFLGKINYFRRFFKHFAQIAIPLHKAASLTPSAKRQDWSDDVIQAFEAVKTCMAKQTVLAHPDPKAQIAITTDASDLAMGATLEQLSGSEWQPLAYFSKAW